MALLYSFDQSDAEMAKTTPLIDYLLDMLSELGDMRARRMFGGFGVYCGDVMVGLIADGVFYLKVDAENRPAFEAARSQAFSYRRKGRTEPIEMSYWEVPADVMENGAKLREWTQGAYGAALRTKGQRTKKKRPKRRSSER